MKVLSFILVGVLVGAGGAYFAVRGLPSGGSVSACEGQMAMLRQKLEQVSTVDLEDYAVAATIQIDL